MRGKFWHMYKALPFLDLLRYGSVDLAETLAKGEKAIAFS